MSQIAQLGFLACRLLIEPRLGIGARGVRLVAARLAVKISSVLGTAVLVFTAKALLSRPSFDQRAVKLKLEHRPSLALAHDRPMRLYNGTAVTLSALSILPSYGL